jgi:hypothetical protein
MSCLFPGFLRNALFCFSTLRCGAWPINSQLSIFVYFASFHPSIQQSAYIVALAALSSVLSAVAIAAAGCVWLVAVAVGGCAQKI